MHCTCVKNVSLRKLESLIPFPYVPIFLCFFSIDMLIELTEIVVCICNQIFYSHSNSPVERSLFIVICWLLHKVHIGGGYIKHVTL